MPRRHPAARRALKEAHLHQVRLVHVHDRVCLFRDGGGDRLDAHRPAVELLDDRPQHLVVHLVQAQLVDLQAGQRFAGDLRRDDALGPNLSVVAHAAQQAVDYPWRAPRASRYLVGPLALARHAQQAGAAPDDGGDRHPVIEVEPVHRAKPVPQRRAEHRVAGGGADQGEARHGETDAAGARPPAQDDIQREVLHRRVQHLLRRPRQPVHLVDEQDVALLQVGQDRRQVPRPLDRRPGGDADGDRHLMGDDVSESGLAQPGRPVQEDVVQRLAALLGGGDADAQVVLDLLLADELLQQARPQGGVQGQVVFLELAGGDPRRWCVHSRIVVLFRLL